MMVFRNVFVCLKQIDKFQYAERITALYIIRIPIESGDSYDWLCGRIHANGLREIMQ